MKLFTIGYGGAAGRKLWDHLQAANIRRLIDVRLNPWSDSDEFKRDGLTRAAKNHGIHYEHWSGLGNPFHPKRIGHIELQESMRLFRSHILKGQERGALASLISTLKAPGEKDGFAVLLCGCSNYQRCHRLVIAEEVEKRIQGLEVEHLPISEQADLFVGLA